MLFMLFQIKHLWGEKLCLYRRDQQVRACLWKFDNLTGSLLMEYGHWSKNVILPSFSKIKFGTMFHKLFGFFKNLVIQLIFNISLKSEKSITDKPPSSILLVKMFFLILCGFFLHIKLYNSLSRLAHCNLGISI